MKHLLAKLNNPVVVRRIVGILIWVSIVEWALAHIFGWVNMVAYVSDLSQLAITISLIPWWQGLRIEVRQVEEDIPNEVANKLIEKTTIEGLDNRPES
jgi:hypothetical protein